MEEVVVYIKQIATEYTVLYSCHFSSSMRIRIYVSVHTMQTLLIFCLSSSAGSIGTSLASQISRLNNAFFYFLPGKPFYLFLFFPFFLRRRGLCCGVFYSWVFLLVSCMYKHAIGHLPQSSTRHSIAQSAVPKSSK